jgi:hypothetical protein
MNETIDIKSLMKVSTFASLNNKSAIWVHRLAADKKIDIVIIDGVHFVRVNEKFKKYVK